MRNRPRVLLGFVSLVLLAGPGGYGCTTDQGPPGSGGGGTGGSGGTTGSAGTGGTAGGGGGAGTGGTTANGNTCASGLPPGTNCSQGTISVGSVVHGNNFDAYEGRAVKAAFTQSSGVDTLSATATISGGAFSFDFLFPSTACNLGANSQAGGAVFIDANGDGTCDLADDLVFTWVAHGGPSGTCGSTTFTATGPRCMLASPGDAAALAAAHAVCPAVGSCFDFCGPQNTGTGGFASICATGGSGGSSGAGGQGGR